MVCRWPLREEAAGDEVGGGSTSGIGGSCCRHHRWPAGLRRCREECGCVEGAGGFVLVLEVHVDVALSASAVKRLAKAASSAAE